MRRFEPGEPVALRETLRGRTWVARPATLVRDADDGWMFYIPPGTRWYGPEVGRSSKIALKAPGSVWRLRERVWDEAHILSFAWPGAGHAVLHVWNDDWTPRHWYVNVEAPLRRFDHGFDTFDHDLDVVIDPARSTWRWKDEDVVRDGIELGVYSEQDVRDFRREGERGLRRVVGREPPFEREWSDWRPDPAWPVPVLPRGWDQV